MKIKTLAEKMLDNVQSIFKSSSKNVISENEHLELKLKIQILKEIIGEYKKEVSKMQTIAKLKDGTDLRRIFDLLVKHERPLHIREIVELLGKKNSFQERTGLAGTLNQYVKKGLFEKPMPNTFTVPFRSESRLE